MKLESERMWGSLIGCLRRLGGLRWREEAVDIGGGGGGGWKEGEGEGGVVVVVVGVGVRRRTGGALSEMEKVSPAAKETRAEPVMRRERQ